MQYPGTGAKSRARMSKRELAALAAEPALGSRFRTRKSLEHAASAYDKCGVSLSAHTRTYPMCVALTTDRFLCVHAAARKKGSPPRTVRATRCSRPRKLRRRR